MQESSEEIFRQELLEKRLNRYSNHHRRIGELVSLIIQLLDYTISQLAEFEPKEQTGFSRLLSEFTILKGVFEEFQTILSTLVPTAPLVEKLRIQLELFS
ncbi:hypothetical protein HYZ64_03825 [Candidatus Berkelbacteria bacterium]|nr:hypothetical protein [Candidatus Berkelbacteria bacterium]